MKTRCFFIAITAIHLFTMTATGKEEKNIVTTHNSRVELLSFSDNTTHNEPNLIENGSTWGAWVNFRNKIIAIETTVGPWKDPIELFRSRDFAVMYRHSLYYYKAVLDYLADPTVTVLQKQIAMYAMENLGYGCLEFMEECYMLYKKKFINIALFKMALNFNLLGKHFLIRILERHQKYKEEERKGWESIRKNITYKGINPRITNTNEKNKEEEKDPIIQFLKKVQKNEGRDSIVGKEIDRILSGEVLIQFNKKGEKSFWDYAGSSFLKVEEAICMASKKADQIAGMVDDHNKDDWFSYVVMMDHPCNRNTDLIDQMNYDKLMEYIKNTQYAYLEKALAVFSIHGLGIFEFERTYYRAFWDVPFGSFPVLGFFDDMPPLNLVEDMMRCNPKFGYRLYPFYILDYKDETIRDRLSGLISVAAIPCGLKEMARKIMEGTLATKEEMENMEAYRIFRQTHFRLYDNIPPQPKKAVQ